MSGRVLNSQETADYLGVTVITLHKWRTSRPNDLPYVKVGRFIRYRASDIEAFLDKNTVGSLIKENILKQSEPCYAEHNL